MNTRLVKESYEEYCKKAQIKPTESLPSTKQKTKNSKVKARKEKKKD